MRRPTRREALYCRSNDGRCHAVHTADGTGRWSVPIGYSNTAPVFDRRRIHAPSNRGHHALTRE